MPELNSSDFPIVGIGASAGGLAAFEAFFSGMPSDVDTGMAFVLVQHLNPDYKSILTELVKQYTRMKVFEVEDGMKIEPNCTYIIPPNKEMAFLSGTLQLLEPSSPRGQRLPIDFFFYSLAQSLHEKAICVVLSGTGSDGSLGVRRIKAEGGMVMAQEPESTEYDGMPRNAITTGLVDYVLRPELMAPQIIAYVKHAFGTLPRFVSNKTDSISESDSTLKKIFILLRAHTSHDFSLYKQNTIKRRIERRMAVHQVDQIKDYLRLLQKNSNEIEALFRDLLIGVTSFFRDSDLFNILNKKALEPILSSKASGELLRIWTPGCSTGEEAYSLAIMIRELMSERKMNIKVQIFATDIDPQAIVVARAGIYPASTTAEVSPERLMRYFDHDSETGNYRIHKSVRDMVIFSEQDLIKDPPFSKVNLISCRNLLIYMGTELQRKIIPLFHYALNPGGFLFLGNSESIGDFANLFTPTDRKARIYQRTEDFQRLKTRATISTFMPPLTGGHVTARDFRNFSLAQTKTPLRELTERALLNQVPLSGVLVNEQGDIFYFHGRTGRYLEPAHGESVQNNIFKMAREGLKTELTNALRKAAKDGETVKKPGLQVKTNGGYSAVDLTVRKVTVPGSEEPSQLLYLVVFEEPLPAAPNEQIMPETHSVPDGDSASDIKIAKLQDELRAKDEYLQSTTEELETSNEELKSAGEEMQSVNEELQSTNEELETSKEELQSVNEELATINAELQQKVASLSQVNNDMNNLLSGTGIGTIFVDFNLKIQRFTPAVTSVIPLIISDMGRPLGNIFANLPNYQHLVQDAQAVLDTLIPREKEVQTKEGLSYLLRIKPYRTLENVIEGVVITFVDITEVKRAQNLAFEAEANNKLLLQALPVGTLIHDAQGIIININQAALNILECSSEKILGGGYLNPLWKIYSSDGTPLTDEAYPVAIAMRTGAAQENVVLGFQLLTSDKVIWIKVTVIPQIKINTAKPYGYLAIFEKTPSPLGGAQ